MARRIDPATVQRILDAADIVEVVSDFVSLRKRGANYIGLCPFHNERTPSFSVNRARGICKCFSCGKGGSPVHFIMELEQLTYPEALRYLAKKYNIEIPDREESAEERAARTERQSLFAVNEFAASYFHKNLLETDQGRNVGLAYFRERGINDQMVDKFGLGYALDRGDDFMQSALKGGYEEENLLKTGLLGRSDRGLYDRFRGRVIYPVYTVSGRVVAFGGRTLRSDKQTSKYVNSPESSIYSKSNELYGLFQAKSAIGKADMCILVEGYMDVISMHQIGICNVVASSGTSLTEGQIRLIRRFTKKVTLIYDSDAAGIKASLRGSRLLLAEGMEIKVLQLPDGEDPDSYAQSHTMEEVNDYIRAHQEDFILFMCRILLAGAANDPMKRAEVINEILDVIAVIPDQITRTVYVGECARIFGIKETTLSLQLGNKITRRLEDLSEKKLRGDNSSRFEASLQPDRKQTEGQATSVETTRPSPTTSSPSAGKSSQIPRARPAETALEKSSPQSRPPFVGTGSQLNSSGAQQPLPSADESAKEREKARFLYRFEQPLASFLIRFGLTSIAVEDEESGDVREVTVSEIIDAEMKRLEIGWTNGLFTRIARETAEMRDSWTEEYAVASQNLARKKESAIAKGIDEIRSKASSVEEINRLERELRDKAELDFAVKLVNFAADYTRRRFASHEDDSIRNFATKILCSPRKLSKVHTRSGHVASEEERLGELLGQYIYALKDAHLAYRLNSLRSQLAGMVKADTTQVDKAGRENGMNRAVELMKQISRLTGLRKELAKFLGERTITAL